MTYVLSPLYIYTLVSKLAISLLSNHLQSNRPSPDYLVANTCHEGIPPAHQLIGEGIHVIVRNQ
jgi:hypothetical protein